MAYCVLAAEACAFLAHVIGRAICRPSEDLHAGAAATFLDSVVAEYLALLGDASEGAPRSSLRRLLQSAEAEDK